MRRLCGNRHSSVRVCTGIDRLEGITPDGGPWEGPPQGRRQRVKLLGGDVRVRSLRSVPTVTTPAGGAAAARRCLTGATAVGRSR